MKIFDRLTKGKAIGAQKNLADNLNLLFAMIEDMAGDGDVTVKVEPRKIRIALSPQNSTTQSSEQTPSTSSADGVWQISVSGSTASFTNCVYRRGPSTILADDITGVTLTGESSTSCYIAAKIDTEGDAPEIITGALADVCLTAAPAEEGDRYLYILLYRLTRPDSDSDWSVSIDYRNAPQSGLYV